MLQWRDDQGSRLKAVNRWANEGFTIHALFDGRVRLVIKRRSKVTGELYTCRVSDHDNIDAAKAMCERRVEASKPRAVTT